ncbi:hypothetical protein Tco_0946214 [Tanacetum coccineum]
MTALFDDIRADNDPTPPTQTTPAPQTLTTPTPPTQTTGPQPTQTTDRGINDEFEELLARCHEKLYPDCDWMTSFDFMSKIVHIKVLYKITYAGFDKIPDLLQEAFPLRKGFTLPSSYYEIKKNYKKIGLGWKDLKTKGKKVANKVLRYFPLTPRLQRMYNSQHTAKWMTWHATRKSKENGKMNHPVDSKAWKFFDIIHPQFSQDPRNIR